MEKRLLEASNPFVDTGKPRVVSGEDLVKNNKLIQTINIEEIRSPKYHDRKHYSQESIIELAGNIKANKGGKLLQPIIVREVEGGYERILGFRRIEAYKYMGRGAIEAILVNNITDEEALLMMLSENIQREDPNIYDQTEGIMDYISVSMGINNDEIKKMLYHFRNIDSKTVVAADEDKKNRDAVEIITKKLGKISVSTMTNRLKMFSLQEPVKSALSKGEISFTVAIEINKQKNKEALLALLDKVKKDGLSMKEIKKYLLHNTPKKDIVKKEQIRYTVKKEEGRVLFSVEDITDKEVELVKKYLLKIRSN